jgi:Terminase DNA packaging enzyme
MNKDIISQSLDLTPLTVENKVSSSTDDDFEYARENLLGIIRKGQDALDGILDVASMSQHPRSFEVVATLINSLAAANKDLLELQKRKQELTGESSAKTVHNNLFIGSTAELQKLLKRNEAE